ncbi:MAG: hypothetical protein KAI17_26420, partial [Thiotrichaceae bacterium]|nr:hypothetical protein [Thiotrichaceae bacterium]
MLIQNFTVKLLENVVLSQRAATVGGHASLDYLPGASFLGATAASLYKELSQADAYTVFFSGKVRFGNAFPLSQNNRLSYPMPLCWHERKTGDKAIQDNKLVQKHVLNYIHEKFPLDVQPVQLRTGYIAKDGSVTRITTEFKMKTAINSKTGRASEGQLFGYSSIPKGMNFGFKLEADQDVSQALFQKVINHLTGNLAIGRSRSAEYGNVKVTTDSTWFEDHQDKEVKKKEITIWLLSDLALLDEFGQSTLLPTTQHFGLPQGNLILEKCF